MTKYLYGRRVRIVLYASSGKVTFEYAQTETRSMGIQFNIPFSDSATPSTCTVTLMNLAAKHRKLFTPGSKVEIYAGYAQDGVGLLSSGAIRHTSPMTSDGTNNTFTFTYREGEEYQNAKSSAQEANDKLEKERKHEIKVLGKKKAAQLPKIKKHSAMSFAKGSSAETIIRRVASDAGIKLTKVYLKKNHVYKKGYTVSGKPISCIQKIAKQCGSQVFMRRGGVYIDDLSKAMGHKEHILITTHVKGQHGGTGLTAYPTTDQENAEAKHATWEVVSLLRYQISTGSVVTIKDRFLSGTFRVKSGVHACDDSTFTTTMEVYV